MCYPISTEEIPLQLFNGDSLEILKQFPDNSIDSVVSDPPYGLSFMGKDWDKALPPAEIWKECIRVLKPGGYLVAMSASRTYHRLAVQLEDLGMICHPMIGWIYGSGFPKATDLSKQFDKQAGVEGEKKPLVRCDGKTQYNKDGGGWKQSSEKYIHEPVGENSTDLAKKWNGYKYGLQALKPALEPIAVFQKTWKSKDVKRMTDNVERYGVGAFNIDACRVPCKSEGEKREHAMNCKREGGRREGFMASELKTEAHKGGRHPANLLHDGSEVVEGEHWRFFNSLPITDLDAPFLYTPKASKRERGDNNKHPTVKPVKLMEWLVKLVTPTTGTTLDPFMGSGSTGIAAVKNDFNFIGIELNEEYFEIAKRRIQKNQ